MFDFVWHDSSLPWEERVPFHSSKLSGHVYHVSSEQKEGPGDAGKVLQVLQAGNALESDESEV